jgi:hypothetical protein
VFFSFSKITVFVPVVPCNWTFFFEPVGTALPWNFHTASPSHISSMAFTTTKSPGCTSLRGHNVPLMTSEARKVERELTLSIITRQVEEKTTSGAAIR